MDSQELRKIIHVDMDAFFAAVEQRNHPEYRGRPVVVGGSPESRGVVSTCSYEARQFGIHSAMSASEARRRCPHAVFVTNPDFDEYRRISGQIREIFREITSLVEPLSLDEAFLDVTVNSLGEQSATRLAELIRRRILEMTSLTASAGVSFNKSLAKIASDWNKPDGLTVITPDRAAAFIATLPVSRFWGVGPVTAAKMKELGIHTGADLHEWPLWRLVENFGSSGNWYFNLARGIDDRPVEPVRERKSVGKERTFPRDIRDRTVIEILLLELARDVWSELEAGGLSGRTITVKVKYADFRQITRRRSFLRNVTSREDLCATAVNLLRETDAGRFPVRLVGLSMGSLTDRNAGTGQLALDFGETFSFRAKNPDS